MRRAFAAVLLALTICDAVADDTGLFVAVGYGGRRITSRDGAVWENDQRWSDEAKDNDEVLFNVAFGAGRFIAVGGGAQTVHILSTRDGREWKSLQDVKGRVATIAFGHGRFVAIGADDVPAALAVDLRHRLPDIAGNGGDERHRRRWHERRKPRVPGYRGNLSAATCRVMQTASVGYKEI